MANFVSYIILLIEKWVLMGAILVKNTYKYLIVEVRNHEESLESSTCKQLKGTIEHYQRLKQKFEVGTKKPRKCKAATIRNKKNT